jgi:transcriptional regulator with XRE-family HTH domain
MDNRKIFTSAADAAAALAGDESVREEVQKEVNRSQVVDTLQTLRLQKGVSQKRIAELMGCDASKVSRIEAGNDDALKLADVRDYVTALNIGVRLVFEDHDLPVADRIKRDVFSIHEKLEQLVEIAKQVDGDREIIDKINQFYGEVLFNFIKRFGESHSKLSTVTNLDNPKKTAPSSQICEAELCQ